MGCRTQEKTPETMSLVWSIDSLKTALWDFAIRYKPKPSARIVGSKSAGSENNLIKTVEYPKMKKLKESIIHTIKNKIIIVS